MSYCFEKNANLYDVVTFDWKGVRRSHLVILKATDVCSLYKKKLKKGPYRRSIWPLSNDSVGARRKSLITVAGVA